VNKSKGIPDRMVPLMFLCLKILFATALYIIVQRIRSVFPFRHVAGVKKCFGTGSESLRQSGNFYILFVVIKHSK
jgi:hypothetical protein